MIVDLRRPDPALWKDRRVLLTGHTGFKGAWMALYLNRLGATVTGVSLPPEGTSLFEKAGVASRIAAHYEADLCDPAAIAAVVSACDPEIVIHFAAQSLVRDAFRQPARTFATNVMGTVNLLEALRGRGALRAILTSTTDKVYFNAETGRRFIESDPLGGIEPYSASKVAAEWVIAAYRASYQKTDVVSLVARAGNIIGGGDFGRDRLIPDAIRAATEGRPLEVRNPDAVRPWQFVLDALEGYLILIEEGMRRPADPSVPTALAFNFGPEPDQPGIPVRDVCTWIAEVWPGSFDWHVRPDPEGIKESRLLNLDPSRAMSELGWRPRLSPREAVRATIAWYAAAQRGENPLSLCESVVDDRLAKPVSA